MDEIEKKIIDIIDKNREKIIAFAIDIYKNPELGYKEERTSKKVLEILKDNSEEIETNLAITGIKGYLKRRSSEEINVALIGELDAVVSPDNPFAE